MCLRRNICEHRCHRSLYVNEWQTYMIHLQHQILHTHCSLCSLNGKIYIAAINNCDAVDGAVRRGVFLLVAGARGSWSVRWPAGSLGWRGSHCSDVVFYAPWWSVLSRSAVLRRRRSTSTTLSAGLERTPRLRLRATAARHRQLGGLGRGRHAWWPTAFSLCSTQTTPEYTGP